MFQMTSSDKDFRFMATNDLMTELQKDNIKLDDDSERKVQCDQLNMTQKQGFILVFQIRIGLNPFYFDNPIPDLFQETDPGKQKIRLNHGKFQESQPKSHEFYIDD